MNLTSEDLCARFLIHELLMRDKPLRLHPDLLDSYGRYKLVFSQEKHPDGLLTAWLESNVVVPGELVDNESSGE